jgi:hypothetical protein
MKWLERGNHTLWVVLGIVLTRGFFKLLMPLLVPENGDTYQLVANDKSLVIKGIHMILRSKDAYAPVPQCRGYVASYDP